MSIVPISNLSSSDLAMLGNNLAPKPSASLRRRRSRAMRIMAAVNRSQAPIDERVSHLYTPLPYCGSASPAPTMLAIQ